MMNSISSVGLGAKVVSHILPFWGHFGSLEVGPLESNMYTPHNRLICPVHPLNLLRINVLRELPSNGRVPPNNSVLFESQQVTRTISLLFQAPIHLREWQLRDDFKPR